MFRSKNMVVVAVVVAFVRIDREEERTGKLLFFFRSDVSFSPTVWACQSSHHASLYTYSTDTRTTHDDVRQGQNARCMLTTLGLNKWFKLRCSMFPGRFSVSQCVTIIRGAPRFDHNQRRILTLTPNRRVRVGRAQRQALQ